MFLLITKAKQMQPHKDNLEGQTEYKDVQIGEIPLRTGMTGSDSSGNTAPAQDRICLNCKALLFAFPRV